VNAGRMVAKFDSATAMVRALAGFLHGRDFPMLGGRAQAEPVAPPDGDRPEAEWGFDPALGEDVERFAADRAAAGRVLHPAGSWLALATGSVPFWLVFNTEPSLGAIHRYLDATDPFDEVRMSLFSHGVDSVGLVGIDRWRSILERAAKIGSFLGVDEQAFPRDFATLARYHQALSRVRKRYPLPPPLCLTDLDAFLDRQGQRYAVDWK